MDVETALYRRAAERDGVFTRAMAIGAGLSADQVARRLRRGRWTRVMPGVYRVVGAPPSWRSRVTAAVLWADPGAVLSHHTAAVLWGFARYAEGQEVHLTATRRLHPVDGVVSHRSQLGHDDVERRRGFRLTCVLRTLLDLAATEPEHDVRATLDEALRRSLVTLDRVEKYLDRHVGHRGAGVLRGMVAVLRGGDGPTESELEAEVRDLLESHGLPAPAQQRVVGSGRSVRVDFIYPRERVIIEADGRQWHSAGGVFEKDRLRWSSLTARGFRVLQWTWKAIREQPEVLVYTLGLALARAAA